MANDETLSTPAPIIGDKLTISHSLAKEWKTCRRKFYYHYVARLDSKRLSIPFFVGTHFHRGMEAFYGGEDPDDFIPALVEDMRDAAKKALFLTPEDEQKLMIQSSIVTGMLRGYVEHYASDLKKWKIEETEYEFAIPIIEGRVEYVGQIDMVVKHEGKLWIAEHKTAGRLDKNYVDRLALDTQITGYAIGAKYAMKKPIAGVIYNVAKKPQIRQRNTETPDEFAGRIEKDYLARPEFYFYRETLLRDAGTVEEYKAEVAEIAADIEALLNDTRAYHQAGDLKKILPRYYRNTDACTARGQCTYLPICKDGWSPDTARMYSVREKLNPELGNVETEGEEQGGGDA